MRRYRKGPFAIGKGEKKISKLELGLSRVDVTDNKLFAINMSGVYGCFPFTLLTFII